MAFYDIFNGDADGICALQQLRLASPRDSNLVTGTKREIALVSRVQAQADDELTVLDVSLAENRAAVLTSLEAGARCLYFDHHFAGEIPQHSAFETHIRYAPGTCTSLLVDEYLHEPFRAWAVVGAYGDNLAEEAAHAAQPLHLSEAELTTLRELGECINYNAYGESTADLHFHPIDLYRRLHPYADPLQFAARDSAFDVLRQGLRDDLSYIAGQVPLLETPTHYAIALADSPQTRRIHGPWANRVATSEPQRAHAVLVDYDGGCRVSVRAPLARPTGADELCRRFPSGGGRPSAAGISRLPPERLAEFIEAFELAFRAD